MAHRLNIDLDLRDIDRSHRVGRVNRDSDAEVNPRPREIIVKLKSHGARLSFLRGRKTLRENREKIFINEDLTKTRKNLAYECRKLKRDRKILNTWVYDGNVFVTDRGGSKVKVTQNSELEIYRNVVVPHESADRHFPRRK